jgi:hypothetical protein
MCSRAPQAAATAISGLKTFDTMHDMIQVPVPDDLVFVLFLFYFCFVSHSVGRDGQLLPLHTNFEDEPCAPCSLFCGRAHAADL